MSRKSRVLHGAAALFVSALIAGCATSHVQPVQNVIVQRPLFPPQTVMETGDYTGFFADNSEVLRSCQEPDKCVIALFNLSFLHCYSKSPYYDPAKALKYIEDLTMAAPGSPWAYQARVWKDLIEKSMPKKVKKKSTREELKAKEAPETPESPDDMSRSTEVSQENYWEMDRQRLEDELKAKEETIRELNRQLQRSRQIDIEMEKKERGLLK